METHALNLRGRETKARRSGGQGQVTLGYPASSRPAWATFDLIPKNQTTKQKQTETRETEGVLLSGGGRLPL